MPEGEPAVEFAIELSVFELRAALASLHKCGGGSAHAMYSISGHGADAVVAVRTKLRELRASGATVCSLAESEWRVVYDSVNAVLDALGPSELHTCTGSEIGEVLQTNLTIAAGVWGAYGGASWIEQLDRGGR